MSPIEGAETARRALRVLEVITGAAHPVSLEEAAAQVGLTKSTAYRLVRVLQDELFVEREPTGGYRAGPRFTGLAAAALPGMDLFTSARPVLQDLADAAGETVTLHRRSGAHAVLVLGAESDRETLRRAARIGEIRPLTRGCAGLAILIQLSRAELARLVKAVEQEAGAPEAGQLQLAVDAARREGFATSSGANHPGVSGIAAPVLGGAAGSAAMSVAISGPAERWTRPRMAEFTELLLAACEQLAVMFGAGSLRALAAGGQL